MHITSARIDTEIVLGMGSGWQAHTFGRIIKYQRFSLIIVVKDVRPYLGDTSTNTYFRCRCAGTGNKTSHKRTKLHKVQNIVSPIGPLVSTQDDSRQSD